MASFSLLVWTDDGSASASQTPTSPVPTLILGGTRFVEVRDVQLHTPSGLGYGSVLVDADDPNDNEDILSYSNGDDVSSTLELVYGVHGQEGAPLDTDFSGELAVKVQINTIDLSADFTLELTSGINENDVKTHAVTVAVEDPGELSYDLAPFAAAGVVLADIDKVLLRIEVEPSCDMSLSDMRTVAPPPAALGDYVWEDQNANGIQESYEPAYAAGTTVNLYKFADQSTVFRTTTTDADGLYLFDDLEAGTYIVEFELADGYLFSPPGRGTTPDRFEKDSNPDPATGRTGFISLSADQTDLRWDAGLIRESSISGYVYHDSNNDGDREDEDPIGDVTIELIGVDDLGNAVSKTTVTNSAGYYIFKALRPGNYTITETQPAGWLDGKDTIGTPGGDDTVNDEFSNINLLAGYDGVENNFGELLPAAIGDRVWSDVNENGIQDDGEPGIPDVPVQLRLCEDDSVVGNTTTDSNGIYGFTGLTPGKYYVVFTAVDITLQDQGGDDAKDSDADPTTGRTVCTTLDSGETDLTWDAGIVPLTTYVLGIHIEKATNAIDPMDPTNAEDADGPTGPIVPVPSTVTWTYLVTNTGDVALTGVVVTDDNGTPTDASDDFHPAFVSGDTDDDDELDVGEVWLYEATGDAAVGQYGNVADVVGEGPDDETVTDDDPSHYFGAKPEIDIEKATNGQDADDPTGPIVQVGSTVTWTYVVTNTGNVSLSSCKVVDDNGTPGDTSDDETIAEGFSLDVGGSREFTATGIAVAGQYENWATTRGEDQFGEEVTDKDPSHYFAEEEQPPEITIVKSGVKVCPPEPPCGPCEGKVTRLRLRYRAQNGATVRVVQKKGDIEAFKGHVGAGDEFDIVGKDDRGTLGTEIILYVDGAENARIHTSCSQPIGPGLVRGDFEVLAGESLKGGPLCRVEEPPPGDDCNCEGKVTWLDLQYIGEEDAEVKVYQRKMSSPIFTGTIQPGDTFRVEGQDDKGTLGTEISVYIGRGLNAEIHTSCSQPIGPGLVKGDFMVVAGASREGGPLCPLTPPADGGGGDGRECDDCPKSSPGPCDTDTIYVGDTIEYTITVTATGLSAARQIVVSDVLDSCLQFLVADHGGQYEPSTRTVWWVLDLEPNPGTTVIELTFRARIVCPPKQDNGPCNPGDPNCSNVVRLPVTIPCPPGGQGCTYTLGYWKNHGDKWPVDEITIGGVTYTKQQAIAILKKAPKGDATYILAHQLIAAKLNVLNGASPAAVADTILDADAWLVVHAVGSDPEGPSRQDGIDLAEILEAYNEGAIGPGHCDDTGGKGSDCGSHQHKHEANHGDDPEQHAQHRHRWRHRHHGCGNGGDPDCEPKIIWLYNCACIGGDPPSPPDPPDPPQGPCGPCDGKMTWLRLQYRAGKTARIRVYQKKMDDPIFDQTVEPGGIFEVEGQDTKGTLGTEITIEVDGQETRIHTSCSQPIYPGLVKGDFLVLAGASRNGGLLCEPDGDSKECDGCGKR